MTTKEQNVLNELKDLLSRNKVALIAETRYNKADNTVFTRMRIESTNEHDDTDVALGSSIEACELCENDVRFAVEIRSNTIHKKLESLNRKP